MYVHKNTFSIIVDDGSFLDGHMHTSSEVSTQISSAHFRMIDHFATTYTGVSTHQLRTSKRRLPLTDNDTQLVGQLTIYVFFGFGDMFAQKKKTKNILPRFGVLSRALMRAKTIRNWGVDPPVAYV